MFIFEVNVPEQSSHMYNSSLLTSYSLFWYYFKDKIFDTIEIIVLDSFIMHQ